MKIVPISLNTPPSISIRIEEVPIYENSYYSWDVRCTFLYNAHKWKINFFILLILSAIITISVIVSSTTTSSSSTDVDLNPCNIYKDDDYASQVSIKCLQKLWDSAGCVTKGKGTVPDNYKGWWLQSPSGGKTVLCIPPNTEERCGAGNFGTIRNTIYICILNYRGY